MERPAVTGQPLDHVSGDIVCPLVHSTSGYRYLLTIMFALVVTLALFSAPVLATPDFSTPFFLAVIASDQGAGAVLLQDGPENVHHPVFYFSKKFNHKQQRYSIKKETLALVLAVQHFEVYLGASEQIVVFSDCHRFKLRPLTPPATGGYKTSPHPTPHRRRGQFV